MIAGLKPYTEYKESGLPWLGQVPGHWDVRQVRHVGRLLKGVGGTKEDAVAEGVPCVRYGELYTTYKSFIRSTKTFIKPDRAPDYMPIHFGDVLFAASGEKIEEIGKSAVNLMKTAAVCGGDVIVLRPSIAVHAPYLGFALDCHYAANQKSTMGRGTTIKHIYPDELRGLVVTLPPPAEQAAIVRFLDRANGRLERAIRAKRKVIALLGEQKQAIIHRAVTRGLDPSVPLKPSGIPWLGDIPQHWRQIPIRQLAARARSSIVNGPFGSDLLTSDLKPEGVPVVYIRDISSGVYCRKSKSHVTQTKADDLSFCEVLPGDVLVAKVGDPPGTAAIYPEGEARAIVTQDVIRIRPNLAVIIPQYCVALMNSLAGRAIVGPICIESTRGRFTLPDFKGLSIVLPPLAEQAAILEMIWKSLSPLSTTISHLGREIELLREYRTRLVADVVTGKLDARDAALCLPDEAPLEAVDDDADLSADLDTSDEEEAEA